LLLCCIISLQKQCNDCSVISFIRTACYLFRKIVIAFHCRYYLVACSGISSQNSFGGTNISTLSEQQYFARDTASQNKERQDMLKSWSPPGYAYCWVMLSRMIKRQSIMTLQNVENLIPKLTVCLIFIRTFRSDY